MRRKCSPAPIELRDRLDVAIEFIGLRESCFRLLILGCFQGASCLTKNHDAGCQKARNSLYGRAELVKGQFMYYVLHDIAEIMLLLICGNVEDAELLNSGEHTSRRGNRFYIIRCSYCGVDYS